MKPRADHGRGAAIAVVAWIVDELIVQRYAPAVERKHVIGLYNTLETRVRQLSVADQYAQATIVQKNLVTGRDIIDDPSHAPDIIWSALAQEALAALRLGDGASTNAAGRVALARFFAEALAVQAPSLERAIVDGADSVTSAEAVLAA